MASTPRRFDREQNAWVDGDTLFVTVTAWRALGENVAQSLTKGMPVVVHGRYFQREYEVNETLRTAYELEAQAVGPDLSRGIAAFEKVTRSAVPLLDTDETGAPRDVSHEYLDVVGDGEEAVDTATGEIRELATA